jgi:hypothetical protein
MGRKLRSALTLLKPDLKARVARSQNKMELSKGSRRPLRTFESGDTVWARNFGIGVKWIPAVVSNKRGGVSYEVETEEGGIVQRHIDQLRGRIITTPELTEVGAVAERILLEVPEDYVEPCQPDEDDAVVGLEETMLDGGSSPIKESAVLPRTPVRANVQMGEATLPARRSGRSSGKPVWLKDYVPC